MTSREKVPKRRNLFTNARALRYTFPGYTVDFAAYALPGEAYREDVEFRYDRLAAMGGRLPEISILAATTENDGEMSLRVFPPDSDVWWIAGEEDEPDVIKEDGRRYDDPLTISEGQRFSVYAEHRDDAAWASPVYRIEIPPPLHGRRFLFFRMYCHRVPPTRPVPILLGDEIQRPTEGWFISPDGTGDGRSPTSPAKFGMEVLERIRDASGGRPPVTPSVFFVEGDYRFTGHYSDGTTTWERPFPELPSARLFGGWKADFTDRDVARYRSWLVQTKDDAFGAHIVCAELNGFWARHEDTSPARMRLFDHTTQGGGACVDCHIDDLSITAPKAGSDMEIVGYGIDVTLFNDFVTPSSGCTCGEIRIESPRGGDGRDSGGDGAIGGEGGRAGSGAQSGENGVDGYGGHGGCGGDIYQSTEMRVMAHGVTYRSSDITTGDLGTDGVDAPNPNPYEGISNYAARKSVGGSPFHPDASLSDSTSAYHMDPIPWYSGKGLYSGTVRYERGAPIPGYEDSPGGYFGDYWELGEET